MPPSPARTSPAPPARAARPSLSCGASGLGTPVPPTPPWVTFRRDWAPDHPGGDGLLLSLSPHSPPAPCPAPGGRAPEHEAQGAPDDVGAHILQLTRKKPSSTRVTRSRVMKVHILDCSAQPRPPGPAEPGWRASHSFSPGLWRPPRDPLHSPRAREAAGPPQWNCRPSARLFG